jgi:hypothetical protein
VFVFATSVRNATPDGRPRVATPETYFLFPLVFKCAVDEELITSLNGVIIIEQIERVTHGPR